MSQKPKSQGPGGRPPTEPPGGADGVPLKSVGSHMKHSVKELLDLVVGTALRIADPDQAREHLRAVVHAGFDAKYGETTARLDAEIADREDALATAKEELSGIRTKLADTPKYIPTSRENAGQDTKSEPKFADWQLRHKIGVPILLLLLAGALAASTVTAHANIVGTELPVFLDNPVLPWSMAALAPMSSLAVKTMISSFSSEAAKSVFTGLLIGGTLVAITAWLALFSMTFHGLGTELSVSGLFDEPSPWEAAKDTSFVAAALATEILVGALLALALAKITAIYAPDYQIRNPLFENLTSLAEAKASDVEAMGTALAALKGTRQSYAGSLALQIEIALLAHDGRRAIAAQPTL